ncbi:MAG: SDR family oxidoreductase, partial [Patescibacteria group bacterium]
MTNKVVIITGATSGIGKALALAYLEKGCALILTGRNPDGFADVQGKNVDVILGDITVQSTINKVVQLAESKYGRVDVLINNAGITFIQPFAENTSEQLDLIINTNLK